MFGDGRIRSPTSSHVLRRRRAGRRATTRGARAAARAPARDATSSTTIELVARGGVPRRDAAAVDQARRPRAHRGRAHPAGVGDGSRVRVAGEGEHGAGGGRAGDLYLRVRLAPHPRFERKGRDLYTRVDVPVTTAVLGGEAEVPTLGGKHAAAEGSADDAERPGVPAQGPRHAAPSASPTSAATSTPRSTSSCPRTLTPEERAHYEALAQARREQELTALERHGVEDRRHEPQQVHREGPGSRRSARSSSPSELNHPQIEPEHLLVALVEQRDGIVPGAAAQDAASTRPRSRAARGELLDELPQAYGGAQPALVAAAPQRHRRGAGRGRRG